MRDHAAGSKKDPAGFAHAQAILVIVTIDEQLCFRQADRSNRFSADQEAYE